MLFKIDSSIIDDLNDPTKEQSASVALEELARAYRYGYHIIYADYQVLHLLKDSSKLPVSARRIYQYLYSRYSELRSILSIVTKYVEVVSDNILLNSPQLGCNGIIRISLGYISSHEEIVSKAVFLTENLLDIDFYCHITQAFMYASKIKGISIDFESIGGGGHTTANQFAQIQREGRRLCLGIVDSDKKYPSGAIGGTARSFSNIRDQQQILCEVLILNVREIENLIPLLMYEGIKQSSRERQNAFDFLSAINNDNSRLFIDLKEGLFVFDVIFSVNHEHENYWRNIFGLCGVTNRCLNGQDCLNSRERKCAECKIFAGFGDPLPDVIKIMNRMTPQKISESAQGIIKSEWDQIATITLSWFCAHQSLKAV